jgi:hypothetical protein
MRPDGRGPRHHRRRANRRSRVRSRWRPAIPAVGPRGESGPSKAQRRAARAAVGAYHEAELAQLIERVRDGVISAGGRHGGARRARAANTQPIGWQSLRA